MYIGVVYLMIEKSRMICVKLSVVYLMIENAQNGMCVLMLYI